MQLQRGAKPYSKVAQLSSKCRGVFRALTNFFDGVFLRKQLLKAKNRQLFSHKRSVIDVSQGFIYASDVVEIFCEQCVKSVQIRSFFCSVFSRIRIKYGGLLRKAPYSVGMRENTELKKAHYLDIFHTVEKQQSLTRVTLHKIQKFHLIFWCINFVETHTS